MPLKILSIKCFCGSPMILQVHSKYGFYYRCIDCKATHGAHQGSKEPLGKPADTETKQLRIMVHTVFDSLWKSGELTRWQAYIHLARLLGIKSKDCHIGNFDKEMCLKALKVLDENGHTA